MSQPEQRLPTDILERANLRGNELAWPLDDIPRVIEAAREAGLVSLGGQLQFRLPSGTCECYWVDVSTKPDTSLNWYGQVQDAASQATVLFDRIRNSTDFLAEGRSFEAVRQFEAEGGDLGAVACFVWYVEAGPE